MELGGSEPPTPWVRPTKALSAVGAEKGKGPITSMLATATETPTVNGCAAISWDSASSGEKWPK
jgi:hypothetical protein